MSKFQTGDVVEYIGNNNVFWKPSEIHIIHEVEYIMNGKFQYSTNRGAWFRDSDFKLVRKADRQSFAQLDRGL